MLTEAGGETASDYESDPDDVDVSMDGGFGYVRGGKKSNTKEGDMIGEYAFRRDRIFKYITVQDKMINVPNLR